MNKLQLFQILIIFTVVSLLVGFGSAYAQAPNDTPPAFPVSTPVPYDLNQKVVCAQGDNPSGDGICDSWKTPTALHIQFTDTTGGTNTNFEYVLPCDPSASYASDPTGASVCPVKGKQDVYVELDSMTTQEPNSQAIADVVQSFLHNGIFLHVQTGEHWSLSPSATNPNSGDIQRHYCEVKITNNPRHTSSGTASTTHCNPNSPMITQDYQSLKRAFFGTVDERGGPNFATYCPNGESAFNCLTAKRQVFHYGMFVYWQNTAANHPKSGWSEIPGNDFVVSLGSFTNGVGSIDEQEGALMHELGHNLGLTHGGSPSPPNNPNQDDNNCAPNYLSVMSYTYEFGENNDICRPLDFSNKTLASLVQSSGIMDSIIGNYSYPAFSPNSPSSPVPPGVALGVDCESKYLQDRPMWYSDESSVVRQGFASNSITNDWNMQDPNPLPSGTSPWTQSLNNFGISGCSSTSNVPLTGFNDWNAIKTASYPGNPQLLIMNFREASSFNGGSYIGEIPPVQNNPEVTSHLPNTLTTDTSNTPMQNNPEVTSNLPNTLTTNTSNASSANPQNNAVSPNLSSLNNEPMLSKDSPLLDNTTETMEGVGMVADDELTIDSVQNFRQAKITNLVNHLNEIYSKNPDPKIAEAKGKIDGIVRQAMSDNKKYDSKTLWSVYDNLQSIKKILKNDPILNINSTDVSKQQEVYAILDDASNTFGTAGTVPEFGSLAMIILIVSFVSVLIIARMKSSIIRF